jgi:hypothetical protein
MVSARGGTEIVDAVGVRDVGVPGLALAHLLGAAVVVADVRHAVDNLLAVELQHDAEGAVRGGMVGAEVQEHEVLLGSAALHAPLFRLEQQRLLVQILPHLVQHEGIEFGGPCVVFLAQRVPFPARRTQDAAQVRVAGESDAEQVPDLALVPVGVGVEWDDGGDTRHLAAERHLQPQLALRRWRAALDREQVVHHREIRRWQVVAVLPHPLVNGGEVVQHLVWLADLVLEVLQHLVQLLGAEPQGRDAIARLLHDERGLAEARVEIAHDIGHRLGSAVGHELIAAQPR